MLALLGEDEFLLGEDVELRAPAFVDGGMVPVLLQFPSEAHGPLVVAASDGAIENLDAHPAQLIRGT